MKIAVTVNLVPDLVEELEIDESGKSLDMTWLRMIINEFDDHAIEQAILIKEKGDAHITVIAPDIEGADEVLYTASAKGADQVIKLIGDFEGSVNSHGLARAFATAIQDLQPDLVLSGVQAHNDMDGSVGALIAAILDMPYVGYIAGVEVDNDTVSVQKEYPGGLVAAMKLKIPAVLGIQAAEQPPRYVAVSKVRQAMKSATIDEHEIIDLDLSGGLAVVRMFEPEASERATMIEGDEEEVASKIVDIIREMGIL
jgi:electron transfer flavoprotein beta subunit